VHGAARFRRYRARVFPHLASVFWGLVTGDAHPLASTTPARGVSRLASGNDRRTAPDPTPASLHAVQDLWARWWQTSASADTDAVVTVFGEVITVPHRNRHRTVPSEHAPTNPPDAFVSGRDEQRTIEIPMDMLRARWMWVVRDTNRRVPILRWWASIHRPTAVARVARMLAGACARDDRAGAV